MIAPDDATSIGATTIGLPRARRTDDVPPSIPDYRFIKVIGRGAFGTVWLAEEPLAGVFRAIKVLDGGGRPRKERARLANRELEGLHAYQTRVQGHPHLIQISKTGLCTISPLPAEGEGQSDGPSPQAPSLNSHALVYYVMEIADHAGGAQPFRPADYRPLTLAEVIRRKGRLPLGAGELPPYTNGGQGGVATTLGRESLLGRDGGIGIFESALALLDGIEHLHKAGIHHRDIKPSNILFVAGVLKLADIGLVGEAGDESIGTSGYLPPDGKPDDLYAFGKVLYEMTTGLPASAFPEWPGDLKPEADRLLAPLRELLNWSCHPIAKRRPSEVRETRARWTLAVKRPLPVMRKGWVAAMVGGAILISSFLGGLVVRKHYNNLDPTRKRFGTRLTDGSERIGGLLAVKDRWWELIRLHSPDVIPVIDARQTLVRFFDLETNGWQGYLNICGAYQIFNIDNPVTGGVYDYRGEINQLWLVVGEPPHLLEMILIYHGQPGSEPGVRSRIGMRKREALNFNHIVTGHQLPEIPVYLALTICSSPEEGRLQYIAKEDGRQTRVQIATLKFTQLSVESP